MCFEGWLSPVYGLTLLPLPRTLIAMVVASIVVADAPLYSISRDHLFAYTDSFPRERRVRVILCAEIAGIA
jgi:hypothetical protein